MYNSRESELLPVESECSFLRCIIRSCALPNPRTRQLLPSLTFGWKVKENSTALSSLGGLQNTKTGLQVKPTTLCPARSLSEMLKLRRNWEGKFICGCILKGRACKRRKSKFSWSSLKLGPLCSLTFLTWPCLLGAARSSPCVCPAGSSGLVDSILVE